MGERQGDEGGDGSKYVARTERGVNGSLGGCPSSEGDEEEDSEQEEAEETREMGDAAKGCRSTSTAGVRGPPHSDQVSGRVKMMPCRLLVGCDERERVWRPRLP